MTSQKIDLNYQDGKLTIDSLKIAEGIDAQHKNIINDIHNLNFSKEFVQTNYVFSEYEDETDIKRPLYKITKVGFLYLIGRYESKKAIKFLDELSRQFEFVERYIWEIKEITKKKNSYLTELDMELCAYKANKHITKLNRQNTPHVN